MVIDEDDSKVAVDEAEEQVTAAQPAVVEQATPPVRRGQGRFKRLFGAGAGVWVGLIVTGVGFGLIAFAWGQTASLLDVALQVPYLISGGLVGLGLIMFGLLLINLSVKRREARERSRQLEEVREALVRVRLSIEGEAEEEE